MNDNTQDNVVVLGGETRIDLPPDRILSGALGRLDQCLVIGWALEGELYCASSTAKIGDMLILLERAKEQALG